MKLERRTARLTILIDPRKKRVFEQLCAAEDATPSQVVRRLIRRYIEERTGKPWSPDNERSDPKTSSDRSAKPNVTRSAAVGAHRGARRVRTDSTRDT